MKKTYIITFSISVLVLFSVALIVLMLMLPQQIQIVEGNINKYESIKQSDYKFEKTKDISEESLVREYTITSEDLQLFKNNYQYNPGNSDPFSPSGSSNGGTGENGGNKPTTPGDKTENGNDGKPLPPASNK